MSAITFPVGPIEDDGGALVTGATVTVASIKNATGSAVGGASATVQLSDSNCSVSYDVSTYGEAWITLAVSASGHTFSGKLGAPAVYCSLDPARIAQTAAVDLSISGLIWNGTVNDGSPTATGFTIAATSPSTLSSTSNAYSGRTLAMTSGAKSGEESIITGSTSGGHLTFTPAFTGAPSNGDALIIV